MDRRARYCLMASLLVLTLQPCAPATEPVSAEAFHVRNAQQARPWFRWWWPNAMVRPEEIDRELDAVASAGFGGVEISSLPHQLAVDPDRYGWGTPAWNDAVQHTLTAARARGLKVDITIGPAWPSVVPTITPDSEAASKELAYGQLRVEGGTAVTIELPLPLNAASPNTHTRQLVAVFAYPCESPCEETSGHRAIISLENAVDLSAYLHRGELSSWQVPNGSWLVLAFWQRGTGQMDNMRGIEGPAAPNLTDPASFVVDHFSAVGTNAVTAFWNEHLLPPHTRRLLRQSGRAIFEDSLELQGGPLWTPHLLEEFWRRRHYDLRPFIPALFALARPGPPAREPPNPVSAAVASRASPPPSPNNSGTQAAFEVSDNIGAQVLNDYRQTLSELYIERRVTALKAWAHTLGLKFRNQPYGPAIDSAAAASATDIPEGESLGFNDRTDSFRLLASGRDLAGLKLLSDECCAEIRSGYSMTWRRMLQTIHDNFSGGVNQIVVHGLAYADDAVPAQWPGWAPMVPFPPVGTGFAEAWGPRIPSWQHLRPIADYLSRSQAVLRAGVARADVAVYRLGYATDGGFLQDSALQRAGFTYQYVSPALFALPGVVVRGRRLAQDGPAYKALVIDSVDAMPLTAARHILSFARGGLPVIIIGGEPTHIPGRATDEDQAALVTTIRSLKSLSVVHRIVSAADLPQQLRSTGVRPDAEPASASEAICVHRSDHGTDYYWIYNPSASAIDQWISFAGEGVPQIYDAWTGQSESVGLYRTAQGRVSVPISLARQDVTILALARGRAARHAESSDAERTEFADGKLRLRTSSAGVFHTRLSDGRTLITDVAAVGIPVDLSSAHWQLEVRDWRPGATPTAVTESTHLLQLDHLQPWSSFPELRDVSGIGNYTTAIDLGTSSNPVSGYYLDVGEALDTVLVWINGKSVPVNQVTHRADVGNLAGRTEIHIEVASTLLNRMRVVRPAPFATSSRQDYGLIGPVRLVPYTEARVGT